MSEVENQKSAEEVLAEVVKSEVAAVAETKADKADLEGFAKADEIPSVEGFVKEEAVAGLVSELAATKAALEELDAVVKSAPAIISKEAPAMETWKWDNGGINAKSELNLGEMITKQYTPTTQVTGEPTSTMRLYYALQQTNPFRMVSTVMPMNSSTMELPQVTSIGAAHEANIPASINLASGTGGDLSTVQLVTQNWTSRNFFSDQAVDDLPGLDNMVAGFMGQQIGVAEGVDMVAQIKSHVNTTTTNRRITTGGAVSIEDFIAMRQGLSSAYAMNGKYMMSRPIYAELRTLSQSGAGSDLVWDPVMGNMTLFGHEVIINDHLENFGAANNLLAVFADFSRATVIGNRKSLTISRHEDTVPGGVYYYGNMRSRGVVWDGSGLFGLRSNA